MPALELPSADVIDYLITLASVGLGNNKEAGRKTRTLANIIRQKSRSCLVLWTFTDMALRMVIRL